MSHEPQSNDAGLEQQVGASGGRDRLIYAIFPLVRQEVLHSLDWLRYDTFSSLYALSPFLWCVGGCSRLELVRTTAGCWTRG